MLVGTSIGRKLLAGEAESPRPLDCLDSVHVNLKIIVYGCTGNPVS